ncbi:hypothetical protein ACFLR1_01200 [Bacteroidota bacterium]
MKRFLKYSAIASIPVILAVLAVFFTPLNKRFAYSFIKGDCSGRGKWVYDRIYENEKPIDVAFIGTSVGWGLFDDKTLSKKLSKHNKKEVSVANLSYCRPGFNLRTLLIEELIATKKPKQIVIELRWKPSKGGHPMYGYVATTKMLLSPATFLYQPYTTDLKNALVTRWEQIKNNLLYPKEAYRADRADYGYAARTDTADQRYMANLFESIKKKDPYPSLTLQESIHFYVYWKNMEYIANLCTDNNIELLLCYVNQFGRPINAPRFKNRLEAIAPVIYPPDSIFQTPTNYWDVVHVNHHAADAMTAFLFQELSQREY